MTEQQLNNVLINFKEFEQKLELGRETNIVIASLLTKKTFIKAIEDSQKFDKESLELLTKGNCSHGKMITAKTILLKHIRNTITDITNQLHKNHKIESDTHDSSQKIKKEKIEAQHDSNDEYIVEEKSVKDLINKNQVKVDGNTQQGVANFYCSYFSDFALKQMSEHLKTGIAPPSYKRKLAVCFVDIVGFSSLAERLDSEDLLSLLNQFFNQIHLTIQSYKGDIDKFIGDALLITFEEPENAARCAIEILLKDLDKISLRLDYLDIPELQVHFGINTGWVVHGYVGSNIRRETTVIGDGVNIASRIQGLTPPNKLYVSASTLSHLGKLRDSFSQLGRKKLKGKTQETMIYKYDRKVPVEHGVLLYETDSKMIIEIKREMNEVNIKNIELASDFSVVQEKISNLYIKALVVGPSILLGNYGPIIEEVDKKRNGDLPIVPIIRQKIDLDTIKHLEKLKFTNYVPKYKERGMEKLINVLIQEDLKQIPKKDKSEIKGAIENKVEGNEKFYKKRKKGSQERFSIEVESHNILMHVFTVLGKKEIEQLKMDLNKLWLYSFNEKDFSIIYNLHYLHLDKLDESQIYDLLDILDFDKKPEEIKVQVLLPDGFPGDDWETIKLQYNYKFIDIV